MIVLSEHQVVFLPLIWGYNVTGMGGKKIMTKKSQ